MKNHLLWFTLWIAITFAVIGPFLVVVRGSHISTVGVLALAFGLSVFVSAVSTLYRWCLIRWHLKSSTTTK